MTDEESKHHFLIAGELVFTQEGNDEVNAIRVNGVLLTDQTNLPVASLGKAQQVLQANFYERMKGQKVDVVDVILINITYLGQMTQEEFYKNPEGMGLKVKEEVANATLEEVIASATSREK